MVVVAWGAVEEREEVGVGGLVLPRTSHNGSLAETVDYFYLLVSKVDKRGNVTISFAG